MVAEPTQEDKSLEHYKHKQTFLRIVLAAVILASGIAIGAGGAILLAKNGLLWIHFKPMTADDITKKLTKKYDLNQQQTKQVAEVMNKAFEQMRADEAEMGKKRDAYAEVMIADMEEILTPEQFERWHKDFQAMRETYKSRRNSH